MWEIILVSAFFEEQIECEDPDMILRDISWFSLCSFLLSGPVWAAELHSCQTKNEMDQQGLLGITESALTLFIYWNLFFVSVKDIKSEADFFPCSFWGGNQTPQRKKCSRQMGQKSTLNTAVVERINGKIYICKQ